jgi:hypothetical protein
MRKAYQNYKCFLLPNHYINSNSLNDNSFNKLAWYAWCRLRDLPAFILAKYLTWPCTLQTSITDLAKILCSMNLAFWVLSHVKCKCRNLGLHPFGFGMLDCDLQCVSGSQPLFLARFSNSKRHMTNVCYKVKKDDRFIIKYCIVSSKCGGASVQ